MIDLKLKINGRNIAPKNFGKEMEKTILADVIKNIKTDVKSTICKKHKEHASIVIKGSSINNLSFDISACCDELHEQVKKNLE
jgi:hypothetical protein